ncbi:MAG: leucine-rich repeat domain-containing protein, partial [Ruminococcus bromii]|nr:leucine-rich repeat domain-containing protein [Ruminococcus bromii]
MKKIKRTVSLLLVAVTLISMCQCSLSVFAATNDETQVNENQGITYSVDDENKTLTISGTGEMENYDSNTPPWSSYRNSVTKIVIKDGVTSLGKYAFYNFIALEKIEIPSSVKSIGYDCFSNCKSLKTVTIEEGCESIENYAFYKCTALEKIEIPLSVHSIGDDAFCSAYDVTIYAKTGSYAKEFADRNGIKFSSTGVENYQGSCGENASYNLDTENCVLTISGTGAMSDY